MKKIFILLALGTIVILGFNKFATAQKSTTIDFNLKLSDNTNCSMPYSGDYYCIITIRTSGGEICQHEQYDIKNTQYVQVTWVCDRGLTQYDDYAVVVESWRYTPPYSFTCHAQGATGYNYNMGDLTCGAYITVTITN